jgi:eukaryotic-like serine/threonine-protein kinase
MGVVAPTPDGRAYVLYMRDNSLVAHPLNVSKQRMEGEPVTIVEDIGRVGNPALRPTVGVSPSGILAFQHGQGDSLVQASLKWHDRQGNALAELPKQAAGDIVRLSPDGKLLVTQNRATGGRNLWVTDLERGTTAKLTGAGDDPTSPIWSPDSKRIIYRRGLRRQEDKKFYMREAGGTGSEQVFLELNSVATPQDWASDGQSILYTVDDQAFWAPLNNPGKATRIGSKDAKINSLRFSPDGKFIAYASAESGRSEVYVEAAPPNSGKWQISIEGGGGPRWRRDGRELYFLSTDQKLMSVDTSLSPTFSAKRPQQLFRYSLTSLLNAYDVSPDGKRFLLFAPNNIGTDAPITVVLNWWAALKK